MHDCPTCSDAGRYLAGGPAREVHVFSERGLWDLHRLRQALQALYWIAKAVKDDKETALRFAQMEELSMLIRQMDDLKREAGIVARHLADIVGQLVEH